MKKKLLLLSLLVSFGCTSPGDKIWHTHLVNPKHLPIDFISDTGSVVEIEEGVRVEVLRGTNTHWEVKIEINDIVQVGSIPSRSSYGAPTLVYLSELDALVTKPKFFCNELQLKQGKALTLRTRPLNDLELGEMINDRTSEVSVGLNKETSIFGIENGVEFQYLEQVDEWMKIRVFTKNFPVEGWISSNLKGVPTRIDNCK